MATGREHFALDWIRSELLETLNDARQALEAYVESERDETRMRVCLTGLHQVHGTLVMLELQGVTLLADHLERLAQEMLSGNVANEPEASQTLMQGILELPGHIDEIQQGAADTHHGFLQLVNEIRDHLGDDPLPSSGAVLSISRAPSRDALDRFDNIDGVSKARKIRGAYQQVLLSILKGEEFAGSQTMLGKVALGLQRVCEGTPQEIQWQAFAEFVASLKDHQGSLESDAIKLLRRVDSEIRSLAHDGTAALEKPVSTELIAQLIDAAAKRNYRSDVTEKLSEMLAQGADEKGT